MQILWLTEYSNVFGSSFAYGLCGVVVKTPARESADLGFKSRLTVHRKSRRLLNAFNIECAIMCERGFLLTQA